MEIEIGLYFIELATLFSTPSFVVDFIFISRQSASIKLYARSSGKMIYRLSKLFGIERISFNDNLCVLK